MSDRPAAPEQCAFCGSDDIYLPAVGIALGMGGEDYSFCKRCLTGMTADEFWRRIFDKVGYEYPPASG
jgi:hypothetical protein